MATSPNQQGVVGADSGAIWMWTEACVILRGSSPFKMTFRFVDLLRRHLFLSFYNDSPLLSTFFLISPAWCYLVAQLVGCELCQETFERFWKFLLRQETASQQTAYYKNWLYLTATNLAIDEHRHNKLINFLPMPESEAYAIAELMVEGDEDRILERLWLQDEVPLLSPQYRESLLMRHYYGYTEKETASKLGITEKTVSANVSRGKSQLHRKYFPVTADLQRLEALHARDEINNLIRGAKGVILINKLDEHEAKALDWRYRAYMRKHRSELRDDLLCDDLSLQRDLAGVFRDGIVIARKIGGSPEDKWPDDNIELPLSSPSHVWTPQQKMDDWTPQSGK